MAVDKIWVYAEVGDGKVTTATLEILTKARELASTVEAVYSGPDADAVATAVGSHGATKLFVVDPGDGLPGQAAAAAIAQLVGDHNPDAILFAQSYDGRDAIARLSAKLDRPVGSGPMTDSRYGSSSDKPIWTPGGTGLLAIISDRGDAPLLRLDVESGEARTVLAGRRQIVSVSGAGLSHDAQVRLLTRPPRLLGGRRPHQRTRPRIRQPTRRPTPEFGKLHQH